MWNVDLRQWFPKHRAIVEDRTYNIFFPYWEHCPDAFFFFPRFSIKVADLQKQFQNIFDVNMGAGQQLFYPKRKRLQEGF